MDAGRTARPNVKLAREALRANPRLAPIDALLLATDVVDAAEDHGLPVGFLGATLLQESAFDPGAMSSAGAVGIAQFTLPTAAAAGIDPWNPQQAIGGAAALLSSYVRAYGGANDDPYALALAAYDAGPGAVAAYHGVPPYAETRAYIIDVGGPRAGRGARRGRALYGGHLRGPTFERALDAEYLLQHHHGGRSTMRPPRILQTGRPGGG
jgi:soluble lytic murein transglycosylase-like protein